MNIGSEMAGNPAVIPLNRNEPAETANGSVTSLYKYCSFSS